MKGEPIAMRSFKSLMVCLALALSSPALASQAALCLANAHRTPAVTWEMLLADAPMPQSDATEIVSAQLPLLGIWACTSGGTNCGLVMKNPDAAESVVLYGTDLMAGPAYSIRAVVAPDPPYLVEFLDKVYVRIFVRPVPSGQRQFFEVILGPSWGTIGELTITPAACNWIAQDGGMGSSRILFVADNTTCTPTNQPIVVRFATTVRENDLPVGAKAPLTVLSTRRSGYQQLTGDSILRNWVELGEPLP